MFQIVKLSEKFAVASQLKPELVAKVAKEGYRTIVALRPNEEVADEISTWEIGAKAREHGLKFFYVPVCSDHGDHDSGPDNPVETPDVKSIFRSVLSHAEHPVLAYCRTGMRAARIFYQSFSGEELDQWF